jgi:hypothetical protein
MPWKQNGKGLQPLLGKPVNPAMNKAETAVLDAYRAGMAADAAAKKAQKGSGKDTQNAWNQPKGKGKAQSKDKGKGKGPLLWVCSFCTDKNPARHQWCNGCHTHWADAATYAAAAAEKAKAEAGAGKANGKGLNAAKATAVVQQNDMVVDVDAADATVEQTQAAQLKEAHAKALLAVNVHPAPALEKLKPYPRPTPRADDSSTDSKAADEVQQMEAHLADAVAKGYPASVLELLKKETAAARAKQAKPAKGSRKETLEVLKTKVSKAPAAAENAREKHQFLVTALDKEIEQLKSIREHKISDFAASQVAFVARVVADKAAIVEMTAQALVIVGGTAPACVGYSSLTAMIDLNRHHDVEEVDIPPCPDTTVPSEVNAMASLWHSYSAVGPFAVVPAITFEALQVCPSFAHTLVGDTIWDGLWKEAAKDVKGSQYIPGTLHKVLKHVLNAKHVELSAIATAKETGLRRYTAAKTLAAQRRSDVDPF